MSFWSSLGKLAGAVGSVAGPIVSLANPILGAGITLGSSTFGKMSTDYENKKAFSNANSVNLAENQKNRDFNSLEAAKQRQFEAEQARLANEFSANQAQLAFQRESGFAQKMWKKENDYNSPNSQLQRLRDAGLNPNLFGGDNTAGSVGSASSSAPNGVMPHGSSASIGGSLSASPYTLTNPALENAQIRLANAQANKAEESAYLDKTQSERIKSLLNGELKLQNSTYQVQLSEAMRNESEAKKALKEIEKIDVEKQMCFAKIDEIKQNISNLEKQGQLTQKELDSYEDRLAADLQERLSRIKMNGAAMISYLASANASNAQAALSYEQQRLVCKEIVHQSIANDIIKIDYRIKDKTEVSTVKLINAQNTLGVNDINVQNQDDWRYPRLFLSTLGQVFSANASMTNK